MRFADVIGHEEIKAVLRRSVDEGRISHAQMFSGLSGWGTLPLALAYVQYVNCSNRHDGDSCGECASCRKCEEMVHPDVHYVFPFNSTDKTPKPMESLLPEWREAVKSSGGYIDEQAWNEGLKLENKQGLIPTREADGIIRKLSYKSFEAEYKAVIVWLPERIHENGANKLLKIMEEPWEKTLFVLVSQEPERLLPTIISRVQRTEVSRIDEDELRAYAERAGADGDRANAVAHMADGDLIRLRKILDEGGERSNVNFERFAGLMRLCYADKHLELIEWAEELAQRGREEQKRFFEYALGMLRECYMLSAGLEKIGYLWGAEKEFGRKFAPFIGNHNIEAFVEEMERVLLHLRHNGNPKIVLVHFVLSVSKHIARKR